jgi:hypothetical protein
MDFKELKNQIKPNAWNYDKEKMWLLSRGQKDIVNELIDMVESYKSALKEIESLTLNPREYEPSYYTINHIARNALENE